MRLIDIKQLSEFLNVKESTLYSWANGGSMPAYKISGAEITLYPGSQRYSHHYPESLRDGVEVLDKYITNLSQSRETELTQVCVTP